jgi:hypothetical protein
MPNWKKVLTSGSAGELSSLFAPAITGSLLGTASFATSASRAVSSSRAESALSASFSTTASYVLNAVSASFASTASSVNTLNQNVLITGSLTVGAIAIGANENTLILGPAPAGGAGEGGQLLLQAVGGTYTSASMLDNWQNQTRLLRGTNAGSDAVIAQWNMHTKQMQLPAYNSTTAFNGTSLVGILGFDANGNILTTNTSSGGGGGGVTITNNTDNYLITATGTANTLNGESNLQFNGSSLSVTGEITSSGAIRSLANGAMYFRGGDDAEFWDINVANTVGIYGQQNATVASVKLGSSGGIISGWSSSIGIGTVLPNSGTLHVNGNVFATSFTGSLLGTASYALSALSSSYAITASYAQNAMSSSYSDTASFSLATTENRILVLNQSGYTINKGIVVHITASGTSSDIPRIVSASYESDGLSANTLGIARETITNGSQGYVTTEGVLTGLDTSAYYSGQLIFLGAQGSITGSAPRAPLHGVRLGQVIREQSVNGSIYVRIDNGYELEELHNVVDTTTTSSYGDLLVKSGSVWTNSRQLTGSYGLTGSLSATSFTGSLLGTASYATQAGNSATIDISSFGSPVESYLLMSNVIATTGVAVGGDSDLRYNSSTNVLTVPTISSTSITGSLFGTSSWSRNSISASFASTASSVNPLNQNVVITGSLTVSGSTPNILVPSGSGFAYSFINNTGSGLRLGSDGGMFFGINNSTILALYAGSWRFPAANVTLNDSITGNPVLAFSADNATANSPTNYLRIRNNTTGSTPTLQSDSSVLSNVSLNIAAKGTGSINLITGSVAIGKASPSAKLDVSGSTLITGSLDVSAGITGSLLGTASFATSASRAVTSSFAITASHATSISPLNQNVVVTGSLTITNDLTVLGSASVQYITSSQLNIFDNIISVNTLTPSIRFGGLAVIDSGSSPQQSGSLLFDSQNNQWIFVHQSAAAAAVTSSMLIMGPQTFNNVGNETSLTTNRLPKASGADLGEHLGDSNITDTGTLVSINSNSHVTGSLIVTAGITGSLFGTGSWAVSASFARTASFINPLNQNVVITGSVVLGNVQDPMLLTTTITTTVGTGFTTLYSLPTASYDTAFFEYSARSGSNARAGSMMAIRSGSAVNFTETTTIDFGSTDACSLDVLTSGDNMILRSNTSTVGWTIKTIVRSM